MNYGKNFRDLLPHEQKVLDALNTAGCSPKYTSGIIFRSTCPAHPSSNPEALATYFNASGVGFKCCTDHCTHQEVCTALELKPKEVMRSDNGLSLADYAEAKQIDRAKLLEYHMREVLGYKYPHLEIGYYDFDAKPVGAKERKSLSQGVTQKSGNSPRLYGMWRHAAFSDYVVIVEGESDCHTLWSHGIAAVGVPGASCVKTVLPDLERLIKLHSDLQIYVFQEPDASGIGFVKGFADATFKDRMKVVRLSRFKDASELHCHKPDAFNEAWNKALAEAGAWNEKNSFRGMTLASLAPMISGSLKKGNGLKRDDKLVLCDAIADLLLQNDRLIVDKTVDSNPAPYMITDNGAAVEIDIGKPQFTHALQHCGMNPSEAIFGFVINHLRFRAIADGKNVKPEQYSVIYGKKLYISSGATKIVVVELVGDEPQLRLCPNGEDGVLFAAGSCFPSWEPTEAMPVSDRKCLPLLNPYFEPTDEAPGFTEESQQLLLEAWLISRIASVRGPILTFIGSMANGKSATLRAISELFNNRNLSNPPKDQRAFFTAAANCAAYMIDNLDSLPGEWFSDSIASACTGVDDTGYTLFKNSVMFSKPVTSMFGIATRSAAFARRRDIQDRLLPLFVGTLPPNIKGDENQMVEEVRKHRSGIFTYLAARAATAMLDGKEPKGLPGRFQPFARITLSLADDGDEALRQCEIAKRVSVTNDDILSVAISEWFTSHPTSVLTGDAMSICAQLKSADLRLTGKLPNTGKMLAIRLDEAEPVLKLMGIEIDVNKKDNKNMYAISKAKQS